MSMSTKEIKDLTIGIVYNESLVNQIKVKDMIKFINFKF